jgi:hypothetical protein
MYCRFLLKLIFCWDCVVVAVLPSVGLGALTAREGEGKIGEKVIPRPSTADMVPSSEMQ